MIPWKRLPLSGAVRDIFKGLRDKAREKAIATGNYAELLKELEREPGQDDEEAAA